MGTRALTLAALALCACHDLSDDGAERLVRAYDERVIEAYRTADPVLVADVTSAGEARRLTALIGVKHDQGITLDSKLVELQVVSIERPGRDAADVLTREVWVYRDRRIGTGAQVGAESTARYAMRYRLRKAGKRWQVDSIAFETTPETNQGAP